MVKIKINRCQTVGKNNLSFKRIAVFFFFNMGNEKSILNYQSDAFFFVKVQH